jgi:hypothetical protein
MYASMRYFRRLLWTALVPILLCAWPSLGAAHKASSAFLDLRRDGEAIAVRWDIALRDLDQVLDLDRDANGTLEWGEIEAQQPAIRAYASRAIQLSTMAGLCRDASPRQDLARREDGTYAVLQWRAECPQLGPEISIQYRLMADIDPTHRAIVSVSGADVELRTLRPSEQPQAVSLRSAESGTKSYDLFGFFVEGFFHILHGFDHLAFLLALLIPAISVASVNQRRFASTLGELLAIISVFTLAHSLTLGLTALDLISLPSRLVESLIALSVIVAGVQAFLVARAASLQASPEVGTSNRLGTAVPLWLVFAFGLVHGMGFGAALNSSGFGGRSALSALLGFNIGVEVGQLAVVAVVLPLIWVLKSTMAFRRVILPGAAALVIVAGSLWLGARALDLDIASLSLPANSSVPV